MPKINGIAMARRSAPSGEVPARPEIDGIARSEALSALLTKRARKLGKQQERA
jgi:hypothetical protein